MAMDLGILRTVVCDGKDLTPEAKHTVGLEVAQPLSIVLRGGIVMGNGHHFCRAWYSLDFIHILSRFTNNFK